jgi:hypothetical protein
MGLSVRPQHASGSYTGDGAAQNIVLGFRPLIVICYNETDGDVLFLGIDGLADGKAISIDTEVALEAADCLTFTNQGFSVGTTMSESAKVFRYYAV